MVSRHRGLVNALRLELAPCLTTLFKRFIALKSALKRSQSSNHPISSRSMAPSKALVIVLLAALLTASVTYATELPEKRDFAGRICIIFNGAGVQNDEQVPSQACDTVSALRAFVADSPVSIPAVLLSSDEYNVRCSGVVRQLEKSGSLVMLHASRESFEKLVAKDGYLQSLKARLASSQEFEKLLKQREDVSRYLKLEIVIASHSARTIDEPVFRGLPVWESDSQNGTASSHTVGQKPVLTTKDFQRLYEIFPDAVVQAFGSVCDGANVGEMLAPDRTLLPPDSRISYTFAGVVAKDVLMPTRTDLGPIADVDKKIEFSLWAHHFLTHAVNGKWQGASSAFEFGLSTFLYFSANARVRTKHAFAGSFFELEPVRSNPYENVAVNLLDNYLQADEKSELGGRWIEASRKEGQRTESTRVLTAEIESLVAEQKRIANRFLAGEPRAQVNFMIWRQKIQDYMDRCFYDVTEPGCSQISTVVNAANVRGDRRMTDMFRWLYNDVKHYNDKAKYLFGSEDAYKPLTPRDQRKLDKFRGEIKTSSDKWIEFTDTVLYEEKQVSDSQFRSASVEFYNGSYPKFAAWHQSFLQAYFPDLVKEVLDKRVQRLKDHVRKVAEKANGNETDPVAVAELTGIRDQLANLTQMPVGPAFDRKYVLPKLQKK